MKRTVNRVIARLAMFLIAIVLGAIAVAQAQRGVEARRNAAAPTQVAAQTTNVPPIRLEEQPNLQPIADRASSASADYMREVAPAASEEVPEFAPPQPTYEAEPPVYDEPYVAAGPPPVRPTGGQYEEQADDFANEPLPIQPPAPMTAPPSLPPADFAPAEQTQLAEEPTYQPAASADDGFGSAPGYGASDFANNSDAPSFADDYQDSATITPSRAAAAPMITDAPPMSPAMSQPPADALPPSQPNFRTADSGQSYSPEPSFSPQTQLAVSGERGNGKPGPAELEGPQTPSLTIVKKSPQEVQVGKPAKFHVTVRNEGQVSAHDVLIRDEVPHGTRLVNTNPPAKRAADGALLWEMGTIRPGTEVTTMMEVEPLEEGDVGSVATISFQTSASARAIATKPQLMLEHSTERQALVGEEVIFHIKLSNTGSGVANNVTIEENVPRGLQHYDGNELEYKIGDLKPGETRQLELTLKADEPGLCTNLLLARADANLEVEDRCEIEIVAPQIQLELTGPHRRFLERQANYEIHVANPGTAPAQNVELVAHLPRALKFVSTNNAGNYDAQRHIVVWNLAELPAQEMGTVELATMPKQMGNHSIQVEARASMGLVMRSNMP